MPLAPPRQQLLHDLFALDPDRKLFAVVVFSFQGLHRTHQAAKANPDDSPALFSKTRDLLAVENVHQLGNEHVSGIAAGCSDL